MATKIYYRAGKPDKNVDPTGGKVGHIQAIEEYIAKDETRVVFEKRLKEEESFRKMLGFTKHTVEEYLHEWRERAKTGGQFVQPANHELRHLVVSPPVSLLIEPPIGRQIYQQPF